MRNSIISLALVFGFGAKVFATGADPLNQSQSGVVVFTATNSVTTSFFPAFTTPPVMQLFGSVTNLGPFTNTVTTTNFTLVIAATNAPGVGWGQVGYTAFLGTPRIQSGNIVVASTGSTNYTASFPYSYVTPPVVVASAMGTANTSSNDIVSVTAVTTTNFTITSVGPITNSWISFGVAPAAMTGSAPATGLLPVGN